jgi:hypothetical protein
MWLCGHADAQSLNECFLLIQYVMSQGTQTIKSSGFDNSAAQM